MEERGDSRIMLGLGPEPGAPEDLSIAHIQQRYRSASVSSYRREGQEGPRATFLGQQHEESKPPRLLHGGLTKGVCKERSFWDGLGAVVWKSNHQPSGGWDQSKRGQRACCPLAAAHLPHQAWAVAGLAFPARWKGTVSPSHP